MSSVRSAKRKSGRVRRWVRRSIFGFVAVVVAVIGAEVYLRYTTVLGPVVQQRGLVLQDADGWLRPAPGFEGEITVAGRTTHVELNSLGMRGPEIPPPRDGELRVLAVGDSLVFGFGVEMDESFTYLLESALAERSGRPVLTRIAAAPGLGTFDLSGVIASVRDSFRPDVVLVGVTLANDLSDNFVPTRILIDGLVLHGPIARAAHDSFRIRLALKSRVCFVVEKFLSDWVPSLSFQLPDGAPEEEAFRDFPAAQHGALFMDRDPPTAGIERILDRFEAGLERVVEAASGTELIVVVFPTLQHCDPVRYRQFLEGQGWEPADFRAGALQERLLARVAKLGLRGIDLTAVLASHEDPGSLFLPDAGHLNAAGHRVVAEHLTRQLADR